MRNFVIGESDCFFPNDFAGQKTLRLVGYLVFGKIRVGFGKDFQNLFHEAIRPVAFEGGDGNHSREREFIVERFEYRQ